MEQVGLLVLVHRDVGDLLHHVLGLGDRAGEQRHPGLEEHDVGEGDLPARGQPQAVEPTTSRLARGGDTRIR